MNQINNSITTKEKVIIGVLSIIFVLVLGGMLMDVYGKNLFPTTQPQTTQVNESVSPTPMVSAGTKTIQNNATSKQKPVTKTPGGNTQDSSIAYSLYSTCLENTKDEPASKNCCDCLSGDAALHKACRDAAATYDFSKNTTFKTFTIPSTLGRNGDYSKFTASGNQQQCKQACESASSGLACGDYQYCRTACNNLPQ
jgi:hypothetical protein